MTTQAKRAGTETAEHRISKADPQWAGKNDVEDMEYAINLLKVKLQSTSSLSEKVRLYNQIKALQDNVSKLRSERWSE
jgi:hypothetical protein